MAFAPDGILEASFDPARNLVMLTTDGGMWPSPVASVTITRAALGQATIPIRTADDRRVMDGWFWGSDHEAPMDATVTYAASGYDEFGSLVATSTLSVETTGAEHCLWLKAPGDATLTCLVSLQGEPGSRTSDTLGGTYQVLNGPAIPVWGGVAAESMTLVVRTYTVGATAALERLLATNRTLLVQQGEPQEFPSGYYFVSSVGRSNPGKLRSDYQPLREFTLAIQAAPMPAGRGRLVTGVTYQTVREQYATYQALADANDTYADVQRGA